MRPSTPQGWAAVSAAYAAVKPFDLPDQLMVTAWAVVSVLSAMRERERARGTPEEQAAFDRTCEETQAWLHQQIEALRFEKAN
jgi:hypothetical protein